VEIIPRRFGGLSRLYAGKHSSVKRLIDRSGQMIDQDLNRKIPINALPRISRQLSTSAQFALNPQR